MSDHGRHYDPGVPGDIRREPISELDLLAYADGFLERDPRRRTAVEKLLKANPAEAARVADFQAQNEALRRAGETWLADPVPDRLLDVVYADRTARRGRRAVRAAVIAAVAAVAAAGGWVGGASGPPDDPLGTFAENALADYDRRVHRPEPAPGARVALQGMAPLNWLTRRISVRIHVPDLSSYGYSLAGKERVTLDGEPAVRLRYRHHDGGLVNIYIRPRWENRSAPVKQIQADDVTALHWLDGPLAVALTTDKAGAGHVDPLILAVRRAIADASVARPRSKGPVSHGALLVEPMAPRSHRPMNGIPGRRTN